MTDPAPQLLEGTYEPSTSEWVAQQVATYEASGGTEGTTIEVGGTAYPCVLYTCRGRRSGNLRKFPLIRVEHDGTYCLVASKGGHDEHPDWYRNLVADPTVQVQDGTHVFVTEVRELQGEEREQWWARAVAAFPRYADYAEEADRTIPVLVTT